MKISKSKLFLWIILGIMSFFISILVKDSLLLVYTISLIFLLGLFTSFGRANLLSGISIFILMYMYFIALGPLGYYFLNSYSRYNVESIIIFSLILFVLGYYLFLNRYSVKGKRYLKVFELNIARAVTIERICLVGLYISIFFKFIYIYQNRAYLLSGQLAEGRISALSGNGLLLRIGGLWFLCVLILLELRIKKIRISKFAYMGAFLAIFLELFSGSRTQFIMLALVFLLMLNKKRNVSLGKVIFWGMLAVAFILIYKIYRDGTQSSFSLQNIIFEAALREAYTGCINLNYMIDTFPQKHPMFWGYSYLINFIMLKPGPDLDFTMTLKEIIGITFSGGGVTPTILGEFYINFGYIGCYIGMFFLGIIVKKIDLYYQKSEELFLPSFILVNICLATRGGIANQEITLLVNIIPYMLICIYSHVKKM